MIEYRGRADADLEETRQQPSVNMPSSREMWAARLDQQNKWDIYFRDERWGSVQLIEGRIVVEGEKVHTIHNLLDSMRGGRDDTALFRSLPYRLRGHVCAAFSEDSPW